MVNKSKNEVPPPGFELIEKTPNGKSANLVPSSSRGVYIAVRRQDALAKLVHESRQAARRRLHSPPPGVGTGSSSRKKKDGSGRAGGKSGSGGVGKSNTLTGARDGDGGADGSGRTRIVTTSTTMTTARYLESGLIILNRPSGCHRGRLRRGESSGWFLLIDKSLNTRQLAVKMCLAVRRATPVVSAICPSRRRYWIASHAKIIPDLAFADRQQHVLLSEGLRLKRASRLDAPQALYFNYVMVDNHGKAFLCCKR